MPGAVRFGHMSHQNTAWGDVFPCARVVHLRNSHLRMITAHSSFRGEFYDTHQFSPKNPRWFRRSCTIGDEASVAMSLCRYFQPRIEVQKLLTPMVVIQQAGSVALEQSQGCVERFDRGETLAGVRINFGLARIRGLYEGQ